MRRLRSGMGRGCSRDAVGEERLIICESGFGRGFHRDVGGVEGFGVVRWHGDLVHGAVDDDVGGGAFAEKLIVVRAMDGVGEAEDGAADASDAGFDGELVVVMCGCPVAERGFDDGDEGAFFLLHSFVVEAQVADEFGASDLEPDEVVGMVDDPHLIGFGITDTDPGFTCHNLILGEDSFNPTKRAGVSEGKHLLLRESLGSFEPLHCLPSQFQALI